MEQQDVISIIDDLANGVDPLTKHPLPSNSPYNSPQVIRALFHARDLIPKVKKTKRTIEEKQQENIDNGRPKNYRLPWLDEDVQQVILLYQNGQPIEAIGYKLERSPSAIISLLNKRGVIDDNIAMRLKSQL